MVRELLIPVSVLAIIASMLLPLPPALIDLMVVCNILLGLTLLVTTLYLADPLRLSSLPSILLLATLYRLALNISTTRSILATGDGGQAVEAFGTAVIRGNLVVGIVVFLVITLVQFLVIAKGAERVAEVSARFTLDALPGKQMSIDADLRAGVIDFEVARRKRDELQTESRFYGALDGAMKFVKGDAVAGLVVTGINIVGGLASGVLIHGLTLQAAVARYSTLTIGDGLVSQIPALLNSLAAGLVVTRVAGVSGRSLAYDVVTQLSELRVVKLFLAASAGLMALLPTLPAIPFLAIALLFLAWSFQRRSVADPGVSNVFMPRLSPVLSIELNKALGAAIVPGGTLIAALERWREETFLRHGLILTSPQLRPASLTDDAVPDAASKYRFRIAVRGCPEQIESVDEPSIAAGRIVATLGEIVESRRCEFVDDILTRRTLDHFEQECPELMASVVPGIVTVTQLTEILRRLISDGIPIRNMDQILQSIAEGAGKLATSRGQYGEARVALRRLIVEQLIRKHGDRPPTFTLSIGLELYFMKVERGEEVIDQRICVALADLVQEETRKLQPDVLPILVTGKHARLLVREVLEAHGVSISVAAHEELAGILSIEPVARLDVAPDCIITSPFAAGVEEHNNGTKAAA